MRQTRMLAAAVIWFSIASLTAVAEEATDTDEAAAAADLTTELIELRNKIRQCLDFYYQRLDYASERSPWGVMHSAIAFGVDTELYAEGRKVNALGWLCWNLPCRGQSFFYTVNGNLHVREGGGVQGHPGQLLSVLAQSRVREEYQIKADGYEFTVADLIEYEKQTCASGTELTFKLIALSHYLDSEATWQDEDGQEWSIPRLIKEELAMPVVDDAACGGTHRMMGFSYAVRKRESEGKPMTGQWHRAKRYVEDYHEYTFKLQNPDGSFSTDWFRGRDARPDIDRRLETTGHILEWLAYSLPKDRLRDERTIDAVNYLVDLMIEYRHRRWSVGPKGHALHALVTYDQRLFGAKPGQGGPKLPEGVSPLDAQADEAMPSNPPEFESDGSDGGRRRFFARRRRA